MRRLAATLLLAPGLLALGACGLHPLYQGGGNGVVARGLAGVEVTAIPGQAGWLMHAALVDKLGAAGPAVTPRYRLDVRLDDKLEGLGLLSNNTVGRERRTLRARYQLIDLATNSVLLDATAGSDAGVDVVTSEYATVASEQTALENLTQMVAQRIVVNVAVHLPQTHP